MKYFAKYFSLCVFACVSFQSFAQNVVSYGVVVAKGSDNRIVNARIVNLRTKAVVESNGLGLFSISAQIGDSLKVFKEDYISVGTKIKSNQSILISMVQYQATTLQEVKVYSDNRVKSLKETQKDFHYYAARPSIVGMILNPISAIYHFFGKTPRNERTYVRFLHNEIQQSDVDTKFNRYFVEKYTPLREADVDEFLYKYRPDFKTSQNWNLYKVIGYIQEKYKLYIDEKQKGIDTAIPVLPNSD